MTSNQKNIEFANDNYEKAEIVSKYEDVLNDEEIDLIVLAIPNTYHKEYAEKAMKAGKHVVVEKPFTITYGEAEELIKVAQEEKKILSVYHNRRWDSDFLTVKQVIENNFLGKIAEYEAHFDRFRNFLKDNWREKDIPGGGILYDLGSHLIDQALVLFGMPKSVYADLRYQRENSIVIDNFEVILDYGEIKATLKAGMLVRQKGPHFAVYGNKGTFLKYGMDVQEGDLKEGKLPKGNDKWGIEPEDIWGTMDTEINGTHVIGKVESEVGNYGSYYQNVYNAIVDQEDLEVTAEQARDVIKIIELAIKSSYEKRAIEL